MTTGTGGMKLPGPLLEQHRPTQGGDHNEARKLKHLHHSADHRQRPGGTLTNGLWYSR